MPVRFKIKGKNGTVAVLTKSQFDIVQPIIVRMMNREIKPAAAESAIISDLNKHGDPLKFA